MSDMNSTTSSHGRITRIVYGYILLYLYIVHKYNRKERKQLYSSTGTTNKLTTSILPPPFFPRTLTTSTSTHVNTHINIFIKTRTKLYDPN